MKVAVVSDIHANITAFEVVLKAARSRNIDALLIAGDLVGYYFEPKAVLQLIRSFEKPVYLVRGNHEEMLLKAISCDDQLEAITLKYGPGLKCALNTLTSSDIQWLVELPHPLEIKDFDCSILLSHGSPCNIDRYIYPDDTMQNLFCNSLNQPDVLIMGHTHYPFVKHVEGTLCINPGSVGQPRNRMPGAHWALLDTQSTSVELFVERYDTSHLRQSCISLAPNHPYLHEVLIRT